ncbi:cytochrome c peroxidase [Gammaproteobacteria bacterium AB-CW1]|uniref:Cytochrome c peroxidase n=1 Tax=Natronospira elongata TaxID=3110268 RepID=A0AAP6JGY6_9GAMM|nr:cytochrome c peroxidase [Gammaproteobacteria bacterium AB-CW1]MEA5446287.1 cytochrome c peroxidase [Gammaproteobacteria bacterium AB-CW1]
MGTFLRSVLLVLLMVGLGACLSDGDGGLPGGQDLPGGSDNGDDQNGDAGGEEDDLAALAEEIRAIARDHGLDGDIRPGLAPVRPDEDELVRLGQLLFFSATLSGNRDVACASCHHPDLAMGDGLSLPIGVAAHAPERLGLDRELDPEQDLDPRADDGPNVPRNSQTIFNTALYNRALFHDGRVFVLDEEVAPGGQGQTFNTPESGNLPHAGEGDNLLEVQALFPLLSDQEMRGFTHPELVPEEYRAHLIERLQDAEPGPGPTWEERFAAAFPEDPDPINLGNLQRALGAFQASMTFVDSPWRYFLVSDEEETPDLSEDALEGARLFMTMPEEGGLGCISCHSGDRFTDESFHNVGFPQIGRGKRQGGTDSGRWGVTQEPSGMFAFRVPSLLNVAVRGPYGHAGSLQTLEDAIKWHADPEYWLTRIDEVLAGLVQFHSLNVHELYPRAAELTAEVQEHDSFAASREFLPPVAPDSEAVDQLVAFLESLTDPCVEDGQCLSDWVPAREDDPDGFLLVRDDPFPGNGDDGEGGGETYPEYIALDHSQRADRDSFPEALGCTGGPSDVSNQDRQAFVFRDDLGLDLPHGFSEAGWTIDGQSGVEMRMFAGGITAAYLDDDCWPDLLFSSGEEQGLVFYRNLGGQSGFEQSDALAPPDAPDYGFFTNVSVMDLNGDYYQELLVSNLSPREGVKVLGMDDSGGYQEIAELPMSRSTWGMAFSDFTGSGLPGIFMAHWSGGVDGLAPALWISEGDRLVPADEFGGTSSAQLDQNFNFSPIFADFNDSGGQDLVIASDFFTSSVLAHAPGAGRFFRNITDRSVITDENGMGAVVGDFDNNGKLDWFVTSIFDKVDEPAGNWGTSGNRFYRNISEDGHVRFEDATEEVGVREGGWGWGACAADFNNNGFLDIFHVNGFGVMPPYVPWADWYEELTGGRFTDNRPVLYINNGDGTFTERSLAWDVEEVSQGTGVTCFDYDRDGDIDIVLVDNSSGIQFFENQVGHGPGARFLNIRLVGESPNTHALGARVYVEADVGNGHGQQRQMREVMAHSSFNGQDLPDLHFGLGEAESVTVEIQWPDGEALVCEDIPANRFMVFDQRQPECPAD